MNANLDTRHNSVSRHAALISLLPWLILAGTNSALAQSSLGLSGRLEYIENPLLIPAPDQHEVLTVLAADVLLQRETERVLTNISYTARKFDYTEDLQSDKSDVIGSGLLSWKIVPDRFTWDLSNTRANQLIDIAKPEIEDNLQVIDITATGPTANFQIGSANQLQLSAQHALVSYDQSGGLDQERRSYGTNFSRRFSSRLTGSINSSLDNIDFETFSAINYRILSLSASATLAEENYEFSIEAGEHTTERGGEQSINPIFMVSGFFSVNSRLDLTARYSDSVQDFVSDLRSLRVLDPGFQQPTNQISQRFGSSNFANLYRRKVSMIGITYAQPSSYTLALRYSNAERSPLDLDSPETDEYVSANLQIPISNRLSFGSTILYSELDITQLNSSQRRQVYRLNLSYQLSDSINLVIGAIDTRQKADERIGNYDGRNYFLSLSFRR